ncbi:putative phage abortive infection protein [uncultured Sneathiella sp.]|uniref:putative phage abortive infection protein n=1 Tax=uncultured Sneathiella sp. TaxID=879315 RepID=UPI0025930CA0|nr:putative phage abortive infection protein [uncultured Sneathiella sp.]
MAKEFDGVPKTRIWPVVVALILACTFWGVNFYIGSKLPLTERGVFGDMFGAVNALFSGVAFVGVIYAIVMQRQEIAIAKKDIAYTKTIVEEQQKQLAIQNEETKKQIFETTFFQLLKLFTDLTAQIDLQRMVKDRPVSTNGKDVFPIFVKRLKQRYISMSRNPNIENCFDKSYNEFYEIYGAEFGHYFRTIYNIIKFIDSSDIENKKFYSNIVRAQLSNSEVALLFHNCLTHWGSEKFKPLLEKYSLLKNLNESDICSPELKDLYDQSAFG